MTEDPHTPSSGGSAAVQAAGYRHVLAVAEFRTVFIAEILAILGQVAAQITLSVLIYERTGSPLLSALTFALSFAPYLFGAALLSAVTDRFPARPVMVATQCLSAALMIGMAVPHMPIPLLFVLLLATGAIAPLYQGTRSAALPDILPGGGYPLGRSLLRMAAQTAQISGFAFGGILLVLISASATLLIGAAMLVASALLLHVGMADRPARRRPEEESTSIARESLAGVRDALRLPGLRPLLLLTWLPPALAVAPEALAAPYADHLGGGPGLVAVLLSAAPVGMVIGEVLAGTLLSAARRVRAMVPLALLAFAPMLVFPADPPSAVAVPLLVLCGAGAGYTLGLDQLVLDATPEEARGRVLTLASAGMMITQGLGFAAAGAAAEFAAPPLVITGAGVCGLTVVLLAGRGFLGPGRRTKPDFGKEQHRDHR